MNGEPISLMVPTSFKDMLLPEITLIKASNSRKFGTARLNGEKRRHKYWRANFWERTAIPVPAFLILLSTWIADLT